MPSTPETTTPGYWLILVIVGIGLLLLIAVIIAIAARNVVRNRRAATLSVTVPRDRGAFASAPPQTFEQRLRANDRLYEAGTITAKEHSKSRRRMLDGH